MNCPNILGLLVKCKPVLVLHPNEIRVILEDDSEIDLVLVNCFPPPRVRVVDGKTHTIARGVRSYEAAVAALDAAPDWLRCWIPVPQYAREWFRNLKPGSKQAGHLWISTTQTLNEYLVANGFATAEQPKPGTPNYDGGTDNTPVDVPTSKLGDGRRILSHSHREWGSTDDES